MIRHRLNGATFTSGAPIRATIGGRVRTREPFKERAARDLSPHEPHGLRRSQLTRTPPESPPDPDSKSETLADRSATRYPATGYVESPFLSNRARARASFIARAPARGEGRFTHARARAGPREMNPPLSKNFTPTTYTHSPPPSLMDTPTQPALPEGDARRPGDALLTRASARVRARVPSVTLRGWDLTWPWTLDAVELRVGSWWTEFPLRGGESFLQRGQRVELCVWDSVALQA